MHDQSSGEGPKQVLERIPGPRPPLSPAAACDLALAMHARTAILVEGWSDEAALEALARRQQRELRAEHIVIVPMGGATNIVHFVQALGPRGLRLKLAGLCDAAEARFIRRGLRRGGLEAEAEAEAHHRADPDVVALEALGFFVCDADLEDELIRALGPAGVEQVLDAQGELASFRAFQSQPAQRGRETHAQLRRFMGTRAGRKIRYGALLVDALPMACMPAALDRLLSHACSPGERPRAALNH